MANQDYFDRYKDFVVNGQFKTVPFISIDRRDSDRFDTYQPGVTRFDILSYKYYGAPYYTWLILQANPTLGSLEFQIPTGTLIRIPYPLDSVLKEYNEKIKQHARLYGI